MQQFQNLCHNVSFPFIIIALSKYFKYPNNGWEYAENR